MLLDGLDELIGFDRRSYEHARQVLKAIAETEPKTTRFIVSCRTPTSESRSLLDEFSGLLLKIDSQDATQWAARRVTEASPAIEQIAILDVSEPKADSYLLHSPVSEAWDKVRHQPGYRELARLPFTIYLLKEVLARITPAEQDATLPLLYSKAIEFWLLRSGLPPNQIGAAWARLEYLATAWLLRGTADWVPEMDSPLLRAELVAKRTDGTYSFRHFSLAEYLLARAVMRELDNYSSTLLSRINLLHGNNLNRFLVPLAVSRFTASPSGRGAVSTSMTRVSAREFHEFMQETGWRRTGFGDWVTLEGVDGTLPWETKAENVVIAYRSDMIQLQRSTTILVVGISWYDALQFCRWRGGRLATAEELATWLQGTEGEHREWSCSWYNESRGLMTVVRIQPGKPGDDATTSIEGFNPDLRLMDLGFSIVRETIGPQSEASQR